MTRGGARKGAGRPPKLGAMVTRSVKLRPDQDEALVELGKKYPGKASGIVRDALDLAFPELRRRGIDSPGSTATDKA